MQEEPIQVQEQESIRETDQFDTDSTISSQDTLEEEHRMTCCQRFNAFCKNEWRKFVGCCKKCCAKKKKKEKPITEDRLKSVRKLFSFETFFELYETSKRHEVLVT